MDSASESGLSERARASVPENVFYARHLRLPGFTPQTQDRLRSARVLIVGVGGLGCPVALYLAGAGVGQITLCDADEVSATNLHRQVLFDTRCLGTKKVAAAAARLRATNPHIVVNEVDRFADPGSLRELVCAHDLVVDGTDNFSAKFAINDACEEAGVPLVYGSIFQFEGQVSVFHLATAAEPRGFSYRDLYADAPPSGLAQNCGEAGVIGVLPGVVGTMQANEAVKVLTGLGHPLSGRLLTFDALSGTSRTFELTKRRAGPDVGWASAGGDEALELDHAQMREWELGGKRVVLVDVREDGERAMGSIGGLHIPLGRLAARFSEIPGGDLVVVYCKSGLRSARAALYLQSVLPGQAVFTLRGGLDAMSACGSSVCAVA